MKRHLHVACALIQQEGKILAAKRGAHTSLAHKWEFPGGKIEAGETAIDCLRRELREELDITVAIDEPLQPETYRYEDFTVTLYPFLCSICGGTLTLHEHQAIAWIKPERMRELDWAAADLPIIDRYLMRSTPSDRISPS